jgi:hypothetical protein
MLHGQAADCCLVDENHKDDVRKLGDSDAKFVGIASAVRARAGVEQQYQPHLRR